MVHNDAFSFHKIRLILVILPALLLSFLLPKHGFSQSILLQTIDFEIKDQTVANALLSLSEVANLSIVFNSRFFNSQQKVNLSADDQTVEYCLTQCLKNTLIGYKTKGKRIVLFKKQTRNLIINGYIEDQESGERLVSATIWDTHSGIGGTTNEYGFFSLSLPRGAIELQFSYLGYQQQHQVFDLQKNTRLRIDLKPSLTLVEIIVNGRDTNEYNPQQIIQGEGNIFTQNVIREKTGLVGQHDVMRYLQSQVGVQSDNEGIGGMYVRGGAADQNLILLDDVTVFNPSHSLGVFSVFNTSMIRNVQFIKDGFSAKYGGRLSSVLKIRSKEGNTKKPILEMGTSLVFSNIMAEVPIKKNQSGLLISARRSHVDPLIEVISRELKKIEGRGGVSNYFFYDFNLKFHTTITKNDRIFLNFYTGKDDFLDNTLDTFFVADEELGVIFITEDRHEQAKWGNTISSLRWNHIFGPKLFSNTTITYSQFDYFNQADNFSQFSSEQDTFQNLFIFDTRSTIEDEGVKIDFDYYLNNQHKLIFGTEFFFRKFRPSTFQFSEIDGIGNTDGLFDSLQFIIEALEFRASEFNFYFEDQFQINKQFSLFLGIRNAVFYSNQRTYFSLQPRLNLKWNSGSIFSGDFSFGTMTQFLHVLTSTGIGLPTDLWVPSTARIKPEQAWQTSLSILAKGGKGYSAKIGAYYKRMNQILRYKEEIDLPSLIELDAFYWEEDVTAGRGTSYGIEVQLQKTASKTRAEINYTYSRSFRTFKELNGGKTFPFSFDRPHNFNINASRKLGKKTTLHLAWNYSSGKNITLLSSNFPFISIPGIANNEYDKVSPINAHRLPDYHRLDVSFSFKFGKKRTRHFLDLGVYNAYNQANTFYEFWYQDQEFPEESGLIQEPGVGLLPSIGYRVVFWGQ